MHQLMMFDMPAKALPKHGCKISVAMAQREPETEAERCEWDAWVAERVAKLRLTIEETGLRGPNLTRFMRIQEKQRRESKQWTTTIAKRQKKSPRASALSR